MKTEDLSTLKINKLTQAQYDKALKEGRINENELYLTPDNIGVNGLPENAEFTNVRVNGGNLSFYDYNMGIFFEGTGTKIYDISNDGGGERLVFNLPGSNSTMVVKAGDGEEKQIATLDDIGSSGGSALDENGNLVFDDNNQGIVYSKYDAEPVIFMNDNDTLEFNTYIYSAHGICFENNSTDSDGNDIWRFAEINTFNSNYFYVDNDKDVAINISASNEEFSIQTTNLDPNANRSHSTQYKNGEINYHIGGEEYIYTFPNENGTLVVADGIGDINISGNLHILSDDDGDIPNAPSTNDIDATFYAQGIHLYNCDTDDTNYLYFPEKTGTLVVANDDGSIGVGYDENEAIGTLITQQNISTRDGTTMIEIGSANDGVYIYNNEEDLETTYKAGVIDNYGSMLTLPNKSGTLATLEDLGDINAILDILNGEVV